MQFLSACLLVLLLIPFSLVGGELRIQVTDESGKPVWSRIEIRGPDGKMVQPKGALMDGTARNREGGQPYYLGSFVVYGECRVSVPAGSYTVVAEHGPEYGRFVETIEVGDADRDLAIRLVPWIRMNELGWWSGDMHVHRTVEDSPSLALAEDLNLSVVFTMWNKRNLWDDRPLPDDPILRASPRHLLTIMNAEDERGGGAWMFHQIPKPLQLAVEGRWHPAGVDFIRQVRATRETGRRLPWFDSEKPTWWEVPVVMALQPPDSIGVVHNHFNQYGILGNEAWGRPRDTDEFPGWEGFADYSLSLYYRYLNLGFRIPPSAGSASGVLPNPVGYNRMYVHLEKPFTVENWYDALAGGKVFVTNGPMLFFEASGVGASRKLSIDVRAREAIERVELIANGNVVKTFTPAAGAKTFQADFDFDTKAYSWLAVRCFVRAPHTIRLAHSAPLYLDREWDASADARYFIDWIDDLIRISRTEADRFASTAERDEILDLYGQARKFYERKQKPE